MNKWIKVFGAILIVATLMVSMTGCYAVFQVPSGYVGKILNPSGFDTAILPPGQVNLGTQGLNGQLSKLVLLEATTITIQEQFRDAATTTVGDKGDHRIMTKDGVPTNVDMYVRLMLPDDDASRNNIFLQVTPTDTANGRVSIITLQNIYSRFVEMDVRNRVRNIITGYDNFQSILVNYSKVNTDVTAAIIKAFQDAHVPLKLQDAQLSQVLPDPQVWDSEVKQKAAQALAGQIDAIGEHVAKNPGYLEYLKWQALQNIATTGSAKGTNTIIITEGKGGVTPSVLVNPSTNNTMDIPSGYQLVPIPSK